MAQIFLDNVDTNGSLTVNNLAWFAKEAIVGGLSMENVHFMTLPNRGASVYSRTTTTTSPMLLPFRTRCWSW